MEKALGGGGQQAEQEPAVTLAATAANSMLGCVDRGRARERGKRLPTSTQQSLDLTLTAASEFGYRRNRDCLAGVSTAEATGVVGAATAAPCVEGLQGWACSA